MRHQNAFKRLQSLPPVINARTLELHFGWKPGQAALYLNRWRKGGYVEPLGPQVGIYFNKVIDPNARSNHRLLAVSQAFPSAVVSGASSIHREGLTTQIPRDLTLAVLRRGSYPQVNEVKLLGRPKSWFAIVSPVLHSEEPLSRVPAPVALADMLVYRDSWMPPPDDLYLDGWDDADLATFKTALVDISRAGRFRQDAWLPVQAADDPEEAYEQAWEIAEDLRLEAPMKRQSAARGPRPRS